MPTESMLGELVQGKDDNVSTRRHFAAITSGGISNNSIYWMIVKLISLHQLKGDVLDFGSGVGNLTRILLEHGSFSSITAIDMLERPDQLTESVRWISADLNDEITISDQLFDLIVAAEIIEHLENPRFVTREIFRMLKPGGTVILTTPNNESLRSYIALHVRGHYVAFGDTCYPAHITALLKKDFLRILQEAGFADISFYYSDYGSLPGLPTYTWQKLSFGLLRGTSFSDNILIRAVKPEVN